MNKEKQRRAIESNREFQQVLQLKQQRADEERRQIEAVGVSLSFAERVNGGEVQHGLTFVRAVPQLSDRCPRPPCLP